MLFDADFSKYVSWDWSLSTHADPMRGQHTGGIGQYTGHARVVRGPAQRIWPICPILGFWGSKVPQNVRFPAQDTDEPPCKIWRR